MRSRLTIGEFAHACGLSRSALRFYDQNGLLRPRWVDDDTGYRFYEPAQLDDARLIRRLRSAEMPVVLLREYLAASPGQRAGLIERHARAFRHRVQTVELALAELVSEAARAAQAAESGAEVGSPARWCAVDAAVLADALGQVSFAIADPSQRPELAVVWVETREDSLRLVTTDSYRLAVRDLVPAALGDLPVRAAVGSTMLPELAAELAAEPTAGSTIILRQGRGERLEACIGERTITVGGPAVDFPEYERILSELPSGDQAILARDDLAGALERLPPSAARVALHLSAGGLALAADTTTVRAGGSWPGPELVIHLDRGFLADAVGATVGPDVTIEAVGPLQPVTLRSADTGTFSVLTMPVRA